MCWIIHKFAMLSIRIFGNTLDQQNMSVESFRIAKPGFMPGFFSPAWTIQVMRDRHGIS
jgi:hypothetical protein